MTGVFIKGKWIDLQPWDDDYHKYFCCPSTGLYTGLRKNGPDGDPMYQKYYTCYLAGQRFLSDAPPFDRDGIPIPDWCPFKTKERP